MKNFKIAPDGHSLLCGNCNSANVMVKIDKINSTQGVIICKECGGILCALSHGITFDDTENDEEIESGLDTVLENIKEIKKGFN